ncbi:MAG: hypothetical protein IJE72_03550 [Clostridia bacterium]|nr:hypothetical protein [Clostridia bacterium]
MDSINDILSSLTDEDMENLRAAAENLFSQDNGSKEQSSDPGFSMPDFSDLLGNAQMIAKISSIMGAMNKKDDRTRLIEALKPLLSEKRRRKADEAMQMMKLMDLLPLIGQITGGNDGK